MVAALLKGGVLVGDLKKKKKRDGLDFKIPAVVIRKTKPGNKLTSEKITVSETVKFAGQQITCVTCLIWSRFYRCVLLVFNVCVGAGLCCVLWVLCFVLCVVCCMPLSVLFKGDKDVACRDQGGKRARSAGSHIF